MAIDLFKDREREMNEGNDPVREVERSIIIIIIIIIIDVVVVVVIRRNTGNAGNIWKICVYRRW